MKAALACVLFTTSLVTAQPRVPEVELACDASGCSGLVFEPAPTVHACIARATLTLPRSTTPALDADDGPRSFVREGARWCATVDVARPGTLRVGQVRRPITLTRAADVDLACDERRCTALVTENVQTARACIDASTLGAAGKTAPTIVDALGESHPMTRDGARWCSVEPVGSVRGLRIGTTKRLLEIVRITPSPPEDQILERWSATETKMAFTKEELPEIDVDRDGIPDFKEPVPWPDGPPRRLPPEKEPDDRSFVDVVGVGDATGFHCTGIVVGPRAVLTAAHCLPATRIGVGNDVHRFLATAEVKSSTVHPSVDLAVLVLAAPVPVGVRPRAIGAPRGVVRMIGFGVDDPLKGGGFGVKRRIDVPIDGWGCDRDRARTTGCLVGAELVAPAVGGRDTCWGDSGGPVLRAAGDSFELVAITSRPVATGGAPCGRGGIYVRVDTVRGWLEQQVKESEP